MGFRFRRTIKIAPGIRLNLSKSGISTSIGTRGATVNLGRKGTRVTAGIPGTGVSYSQTVSPASRERSPDERGTSPLLWVLLIIVIVAVTIAKIYA